MNNEINAMSSIELKRLQKSIKEELERRDEEERQERIAASIKKLFEAIDELTELKVTINSFDDKFSYYHYDSENEQVILEY